MKFNTGPTFFYSMESHINYNYNSLSSNVT